tara:strand:- start:473 stop:742 length:270 start_codon:yes stop_codon:yes gene_type:complete
MIEEIDKCLREKLSIIHLEITDNSSQHAGHKGKTSDGGHFSALIVSDDFIDIPLINRHRLVYNTLGNLMDGAIHAFSMKTLTLKEYNKI